MVVGDNTPVWSDLGQTSFRSRRLPGARQSYCNPDVYGQECPEEELFGLGDDVFGVGQVMFPNIKRADYAVNPLSGMGQVLFPNIKRADYAVNPLSGFGTVRIPDTDSIGTVRVPDSSDAFNGFGTVRIPDMDSFGFLGQEAPAAPAAPGTAKAFIGNWGLAPWLAAAALIGGSYFAKGNLKALLQGMGVVAGGMGAVGLVGKLTK